MKRRFSFAFQQPALELGAASLLAALCVRIPGADLGVHLRLILALGLFAFVGAAIERAIGFETASRWQAICLGQLGLGVWFWFRSLLCEWTGLPGVTTAELCVLVLIATAAFHKPKTIPADRGSPLPARLITLLGWAALLFLFVGARSGAVGPPSSDPELHVFWTRLTVWSGHIAHTAAPFFSQPITYPSGFSVLDSLWVLLSGNSPVATVDLQVAVQGALTIGLVLELGESIAGRIRPLLSLAAIALLGLFAHWLLGGDRGLSLAGTPRLASFAMCLLPFVLAARMRLAIARGEIAPGRAWCGFALIAPPLVTWALLQNPTCVLSSAIASAAGAELLFVLPSAKARIAPILIALVAGALLSSAMLAEDGWVRSRIHGVSSAVQPPPALSGADSPGEPDPVPGPPRPPPLLETTDAMSGEVLGTIAIPLAILLSITLVIARRRARRSTPSDPAANVAPASPEENAVLVSTAQSAVLLAGAVAMIAALLIRAAFTNLPLAGELGFLREYGRGLLGAFAAMLALALLILLALILVSQAEKRGARSLIISGAALGAALLALAALRAPAVRADLELTRQALFSPPRGDLGVLTSDDLALVQKANALIPAGERVLLPSLPVAAARHENWLYPIASSRAALLAGTFQFAFGYAIGGADFEAESYRRRVCRSLDLDWLIKQGVRWMLVSPRSLDLACVHADGGGPALWEAVQQAGDSVLLHLRGGALARWKSDGSLHALDAPVVTGPESTIRGAAELSGPVGLKGWACANAPPNSERGNPSIANVELELFAPGSGAPLWHEVRFASEPSKSGESAGCGPNHGYAFAPIAPRGRYQARLRAISPDGTASTVLADRFAVSIDY